MKTQDRKSVIEAVVIAGLSAVATGLVNIGMKRYDAALERKETKRREEDDAKQKKSENG